MGYSPWGFKESGMTELAWLICLLTIYIHNIYSIYKYNYIYIIIIYINIYIANGENGKESMSQKQNPQPWRTLDWEEPGPTQGIFSTAKDQGPG